MRSIVPFCVLVLSLVLVLVSVAVQASGMVIYQEEVDLSEGGTTMRPVLEIKTHRVRFQPPARWHMELTSTNQTVMFYEPDLRAGILMRLWTEDGTNSSTNSSTGWRERVGQRLEQSEVIAQFKVYSANTEGLGMDLEQWVNPTTRAAYRIALIPFEGGLAEFELRTSAERAPHYHRIFRHLLGSFSAERRGGDSVPKPTEGGSTTDAADGGMG